MTFSYATEPVVQNVNLTVGPRELTCIVGPNGGGKTTLLKLMLGLLRPDTGQVLIFGRPPERMRSRLGYMPQHLQYDPQFPVTVMDIVLMGRLGRRWGGRYTPADKAAARAALEQLGVDGLADRLFAKLSGGQRQRILIARALACEPALLLLDEPTANVDALVEVQLMEILQQLNQRMAVLMVTHDLGFVSDVVENVICVNRKVVVHPTSEITGEVIHDIYGDDRRMVRHDHKLPH